MNMNLLERAANALKQQNYTSAHEAYHKIVSNPANYSVTQVGKAHYGLGYIAQLHQDWPNAIEAFQLACQLLPETPSPLLGLANAFNAVLSDIDALTTLEYAHRRFPNDDNVTYALLQQNITMGKNKKNGSLIKPLLSTQQDELFALALLDTTKLDKQLIQDQHIQRAEALIQHYQTHHHSQFDTLAALLYALGELSYHINDFAKAQEYWQQANECQRTQCRFNTQDMAPYFQSLLNISRVEESTHALDPISFTPVFIVSLPRTGSSLLAHQLVQHGGNEIANAGEVNYLSETVNWLCQQTQHPYPDCLSHLTPALINNARRRYAQLIATHRLNTRLIIDKLPANFQSLPIIVQLFPEAHIIHLTRSYANTALSIMRNSFAANEPYFCNEDELFIYMDHYHQIMSHYTAIYPEKILSVHYEELVQDLPAQLADIYVALGITRGKQIDISQSPMNDSSIRTLSAIQARLPVYQSSITLDTYWQVHFERFNDIGQST